MSLPQYNIFERFNTIDCIKHSNLSKNEIEHCKYLSKNKLIIIDDEGYKLNYNFRNKKVKIDIHGFVPKMLEEKKKVDDIRYIEEDRKIVIQSTLVRIMKTRKTLEHNKLIQECIEDVKRFTPKVSMIKRCVEMLIDKEYFERDVDNRQIYNYVA